MMRALYGQAQALPASLFELGISPHINASIIITILLLLPKDLLPFPWADRLREARKEGKGVSTDTHPHTSPLSTQPAGSGCIGVCGCRQTKRTASQTNGVVEAGWSGGCLLCHTSTCMGPCQRFAPGLR